MDALSPSPDAWTLESGSALPPTSWATSATTLNPLSLKKWGDNVHVLKLLNGLKVPHVPSTVSALEEALCKFTGSLLLLSEPFTLWATLSEPLPGSAGVSSWSGPDARPTSPSRHGLHSAGLPVSRRTATHVP